MRRLLASCLLASIPWPVSLGIAQEVSVKVSVRLVNILATVRNAGGELAPALTRDDFEVRENDVPQPLRVFTRESGRPLSIAMLLDASLSTAKELKFEQESAVRFIRSILGPNDRMSLFTFTEDVIQVSPFTSSAERLERAVRAVRARGGTSLFDAIYLASGELQRLEGRRVMVVISDGGDTTSDLNFHRALRAAQNADTVIYSVVIVPIRGETGRNIGGEHGLAYLSERTGGRAFTPDSPAQLDPAFAAIGEELRTQYVLGYYAAPPAGRSVSSGLPAAGDERSDGWRRIEVRVRTPGFTVQARKGYYLNEP